MVNESNDLPELSCQWCSGTIPENASACTTCGAARPRADLVAPGYVQPDDVSISFRSLDDDGANADDDETKAKQILKDLDAYIPEEQASPRRASSNAGDDALMIIGVLAISGLTGGLMGWFLAPSLIHEVFNEMIGVETDGPEAFRRLGGFLGALIAMLLGSLLVTFIRR